MQIEPGVSYLRFVAWGMVDIASLNLEQWSVVKQSILDELNANGLFLEQVGRPINFGRSRWPATWALKRFRTPETSFKRRTIITGTMQVCLCRAVDIIDNHVTLEGNDAR